MGEKYQVGYFQKGQKNQNVDDHSNTAEFYIIRSLM